MATLATKFDSIDPLCTLIGELESLAGRITGDAITKILARSHLRIDDVASGAGQRGS